MSRRRILVDVDGVLADFAGAALKIINDRLDRSHTVDEVVKYDMFKCLDVDESVLVDAVENHFFVQNIEPYPGSRKALEVLEKEFGNVYVITSPYDSPAWMGQRSLWLKERMGIPISKQGHIKPKHIVAGCCLIDDAVHNLQAWGSHWPAGLPVLVDRPWNQGDDRFARTHSWFDVFDALENHFTSVGKAHK